MFAGGGCVAGGCIPAKPQWSKVLIFLAFSSDRESARRSKVSGVVSSYIHLFKKS
jgi:pyruvate/2-oxoglutarate dehydrogenase complex dihydrolipoamide dehydrogenase (E3) component